MDTVNIVLCGLGGQGILFMTKVLARAALDKGYDIMVAETHGMAQRGGSVVSHLRIGEVESSLVKTESAHYLLALEENESYRNLPFLSQKACMVVNTLSGDFPRPEVKAFLDKKEIRYRSIPAGKIAQELGAPMVSNLAILGCFTSFEDGPVGHEELRRTIENISPERFKKTNLKVFDRGYQRGEKK